MAEGFSSEILGRHEREFIDSLPVGSLEKTRIVLVLAGVKPAHELLFDIAIPEGVEDSVIVTEEEVSDWARELEGQGLAVVRGIPKVSHGYTSVVLNISRDEATAQRLASINNRIAESNEETRIKIHEDEAEELGALYGFPKTAAHAFAQDKQNGIDFRKGDDRSALLPHEEYPTGDFMAFCTFRLSKAHWQEEIEVVKKWAETVQRLHPELYEKVVTKKTQ